MPFFIDTCKALEKEVGEELSLVHQLVVALVLEKKHVEYLQQHALGPSDNISFGGKWPSKLAAKLNVEENVIQVG
jgi:hypothetical protein